MNHVIGTVIQFVMGFMLIRVSLFKIMEKLLFSVRVISFAYTFGKKEMF
jgi:hypothetical protein